jgi:hypothetical protein
MEVLGNMATLPTLDGHANVPEVRPLPSIGITRLHRYYEPLRRPTRPGLALAGVRLVHFTTAGASRVATVLLIQTCRHHYPGGTAGGNRVVPLNEPATAAFPIPLLGRLPHCAFRGLLGVHSRYGLPARGTAYAVLCIEGFGSFVTSTTAPIATGWNDSCRVGIAPTEERRLVTAHKGTGNKRGLISFSLTSGDGGVYDFAHAAICALRSGRLCLPRPESGGGTPSAI